MTQQMGNLPPAQAAGRSTPDVAKEQAAEVGQTAVDRGQEVAGVAAGQAKEVVSEAGRQASDLLDQGKTQLREQARNSQEKAASGLRAIADHLQKMSDQTDEPGIAADVVREAAQRTHGVASWLDSREPGDLLNEVRSFARRKPGVFLAGAAIAGVLAGRLTRGVTAASQSSGSGSTGNSGGYPAQTADVGSAPRHAAAPAVPPAPATYPPTMPATAPPGSVGQPYGTTAPPPVPPLPQPSGYPPAGGGQAPEYGGYRGTGQS